MAAGILWFWSQLYATNKHKYNNRSNGATIEAQKQTKIGRMYFEGRQIKHF